MIIVPIRLTNIKSKITASHPEMDGGDLSATQIESDGQSRSVGPGERIIVDDAQISLASYSTQVVEDTGDHNPVESSRS